jgi:hypothetical protein
MSSVPDYLKVALWVSGLGGIVALICLGYVVWSNGNSRNLALGAGALLGSVILMAVQLLFELRSPPTETDTLSIEYTIDQAVPQIRQWSYRHGGWRVSLELGAGKALGQTNPELFKNDPEKVTKDMTLFSVIGFFFWEQRDWQLRRAVFRGKTSGTFTYTQPSSPPDECTTLTRQAVLESLRAAGNSFASVSGQDHLPDWHVCFPPQSTLVISANSIAVTNPFCELSLNLHSPGGGSFSKPGTQEGPQLPDGRPQFETRVMNIETAITYSALRAQHMELPKYQKWATGTVDGLRKWFEDDEQ